MIDKIAGVASIQLILEMFFVKVYLSLENKVIDSPPEEIPEFYTVNKWQLVFSDSMNMYVTVPPSPGAAPLAPVPGA